MHWGDFFLTAFCSDRGLVDLFSINVCHSRQRNETLTSLATSLRYDPSSRTDQPFVVLNNAILLASNNATSTSAFRLLPADVLRLAPTTPRGPPVSRRVYSSVYASSTDSISSKVQSAESEEQRQQRISKRTVKPPMSDRHAGRKTALRIASVPELASSATLSQHH
jgi:hypothetical protein